MGWEKGAEKVWFRAILWKPKDWVWNNQKLNNAGLGDVVRPYMNCFNMKRLYRTFLCATSYSLRREASDSRVTLSVVAFFGRQMKDHYRTSPRKVWGVTASAKGSWSFVGLRKKTEERDILVQRYFFMLYGQGIYSFNVSRHVNFEIFKTSKGSVFRVHFLWNFPLQQTLSSTRGLPEH